MRRRVSGCDGVDSLSMFVAGTVTMSMILTIFDAF